MKKLLFTICILNLGILLNAQNETKSQAYNQIPIVYSNIVPGDKGEYIFDGSVLFNYNPFYTLDNIRISPKGNKKGIVFDFRNIDFSGTIYYGLLSKETPKYPQTVFFKNHSPIRKGIAEIDIAELKGRYDIADWEKTGKARLGYRITNRFGNIIYDGKINIEGKGPFKTGLSIVEGPYVNMVSNNEVYISFITNDSCRPFIEVGDKEYRSLSEEMNNQSDLIHEIKIDYLYAATIYEYTVHYGNSTESHSFQTSPISGSRKPFMFAFTSDSRAGQGGGERDIYGTNAYVMKKMAALAVKKNASFFQFTGDMINGYSSSIGETNLQYANWKRNVEPFWHYIPFNIGMGNHEAVVNIFDDGSIHGIQVDKWPFETSSAERVFADNFINPINGPVSEDGSVYDPKLGQQDFPSYEENVFYYTYDNVAMVVLNSNYWYAPSTYTIPEIGGNPHGYIMDNQLKWLEKTLLNFETNPNIDHVFVTIHTPAFPNGGHAGDDMWYNGSNMVRPTIAGQPVEKGIIERRDEFLDLLINKNQKVVALLCGDEHNYSRLKLTNKTEIYPEYYHWKKIKITRPFWQITNGSAGAPYYGQQQLPWSGSVEKFSTQYALMLFYIDGNKITLQVINPDTLEDIEEVILKE